MKSRYLTLYGQLRDGGLSLPEINLNPFCMDKAIDLFEYYEEVKRSDGTQLAPDAISKKSSIMTQILSSPLHRPDLNDIGDRPWNPLFLDSIFAYHYSKPAGMVTIL